MSSCYEEEEEEEEGFWQDYSLFMEQKGWGWGERWCRVSVRSLFTAFSMTQQAWCPKHPLAPLPTRSLAPSLTHSFPHSLTHSTSRVQCLRRSFDTGRTAFQLFRAHMAVNPVTISSNIPAKSVYWSETESDRWAFSQEPCCFQPFVFSPFLLFTLTWSSCLSDPHLSAAIQLSRLSPSFDNSFLSEAKRCL